MIARRASIVRLWAHAIRVLSYRMEKRIDKPNRKPAGAAGVVVLAHRARIVPTDVGQHRGMVPQLWLYRTYLPADANKV